MALESAALKVERPLQEVEMQHQHFFVCVFRLCMSYPQFKATEKKRFRAVIRGRGLLPVAYVARHCTCVVNDASASAEV